MATLKKGDLTIEANLPAEIVNLKAQGFRVVKPADKPAEPEAPADDGASTDEAPKPSNRRK